MRYAISRFLQEKFYIIFVFLLLGEGIFFNALYWMQPSSEKNARLFGYSSGRLLIGCAAFLILAGLAGIFFAYVRKAEFHRKINTFVLSKLRFPLVRMIFYFLSVLIVLSLSEYLLNNWFHRGQATFSNAIYLLIFPFVLWVILAILEGAGLVAWTCLRFLRPLVTKKEILTTFLVSFTSILVVWQWATLNFRLNWHYLFSQVLWTATDTNYAPLHYIFIIGWGLAAIALYHWVRKYGFRRFVFLLLIVWGYIGQLVIPIRDTQHIDDTLTRYQNAAISQILGIVCTENPGYVRILSQYEQYEGSSFWLATKPPGYFLSYAALAGTAAKLSRIPCQQSLPVAILFIFPLLAVLTLLPLYKLSQVLYKGNSAYVCVLFFTLPSIIFFTLIADQAWYPLLFISSAWLTVETTRRSNFLMAALLGIFLYLEIFISFSLLPAAGFTVVWILLNWLAGSKQNRGRLFKQALLILLGFTAIYFLFRIFGGYDAWLRYQNAFINHRENKNFGGGVGEVLSFTFLNNLEFFYFIGFPPAILFLLNVTGGVRKLFKRTFTLPVLFSVSAGAVFVLLNVIGQTRGETARLWLFITPLIALVAGERLLRLPNWAQDALVIVQLITVVFMFQFYYTL